MDEHRDSPKTIATTKTIAPKTKIKLGGASLNAPSSNDIFIKLNEHKLVPNKHRISNCDPVYLSAN